MKLKYIILIHIVFWIVTIISDISPLFFISDSNLIYRSLVKMSLLVPICAGVFYISYFFITPFLLRKKFLLFSIIFFLFIGLYTFIILLFYIPAITHLLVVKQEINYPLWYLTGFSRHFVYGLWGTFFCFTISWFKTRQSQKELEKQNLNSELSLLRSQINPHFLFNILNNINSYVEREPKKAEYGIEKLSDIMKYMLYQANTDKVPLDNEISYIKNYIELQKLRIKESDFISFSIQGITSDIMIPSMLLVPFVENAFKHGKKQDVSPGIIINLSVFENNLHFYIANYLLPQYETQEKSGGFGLKNIKRRLELIYNNNYELNINNENDMFIVSLDIKLSI